MTLSLESPPEPAVRFGLAELDLLATYAGARPPFPLRVPSVGRIEDERRALLGSAGQALAERGLATGNGPLGLAADLVEALRGHRSTVDLVVAEGTETTGVVAMVCRHHTVVCRQSIGGEPGPVTVTRVRTAALTDEFTVRIPKAAPAPALPITLPPGVVGDATRLLENTTGEAAPLRRARELVRERGGDESAVDALVTLLPSVVGRGQLGVVVRPEGGHAERPRELSWLDGSRGRVRVDHDERGWVSVNPLRHSELLRELRDAAALARG
ncbi:ESX secretion-associated protein EspG [Prauserella cavernicola]|uniref:ESX secretion-associated protein EspG n=1 Tax=Prauserella cavernicola TaxID=2800127 RepID=A0A934QPY1_9PSEU|nr:ESX secretion-associated protein EspG [Prauserella cavernicola]MBK1783574.1 ESX secretion-associated protein EspG [Prauserella cavernicola]